MKLTKEQLRKIIKEELSSINENNPFDEPEDDYSREMRMRDTHGRRDPPTTMSGAPSANDFRTAIAEFVKENPQLACPRSTIMSIVEEETEEC